MIQKTPRLLSDGYCYDWKVDIDPEKRDPLVGRGPDKHADAYHEWHKIIRVFREWLKR